MTTFRFAAVVLTTTAVSLAASAPPALAQTPVSTTFTYQGRLKINGVLHNAPVDLCFSFYDDPDVGEGNLIGDSQLHANVMPSKGLFSVELGYGTDSFNGDARWLQIAVRSPAGGPANCVTGFTVLPQRQPITPAPYAVHALTPWVFYPDTEDVVYHGQVGINETPSFALQVQGSGNTFISRFRNASPDGGGVHIMAGAHGPGGPPLLWVSTHAGESQLIVAQDGNVGIGTSTPDGQLHVAGLPSQLILECTNLNQNPILEFRHPSVPLLPPTEIGLDRSDGGVYFNVAGVTALEINRTGPFPVVMIGTESAASMLTVNGCITATNTSSCSDVRFKDNCVRIGQPLDLIHQLQGIRFDWRRNAFPGRDFSDSRQIGFIAQDVRMVIPEAVFEGKDGYLGIDYGRLTPVLVEAVKELHGIVQDKDAQLAAQRDVNSQQQEQINDLTERLAAIERLIAAQATLVSGNGDPALTDSDKEALP